MVAIFVNGNRVGLLSDLESILPTLSEKHGPVELRDDGTGRKLATVTPEPICPWEPTLTESEIDRRCQKSGKPLKEILERLGVE